MTLDIYRQPIAFSHPGAEAARLANLPRDPEGLAKIVQGLMIHEHIAQLYDVTLTAEQHAQAHVRSVEGMLAAIAARDGAPLAERRAAGRRQVGVCRHFTLLHVAMLRHHGVPARARCGFAAYFQKGKFLDHWVTEHWDSARGAWVLADPQVDELQRSLFKVAFDPADVPRDQFLVAGDAWRLCRSGTADPQDFGILDMFGLWFVAGNVVRDLAALNNREMLPWDVWGPMAAPGQAPDLALFDRLAELSRTPDAREQELRATYRDTLAVPPTVFNAVLNRPETV